MPPQPSPKAMHIDTAVAHIKQAAERALFSDSDRQPYKHVAALMALCDNDDMGFRPLHDELAKIFRRVYGYMVEQYTIQSDCTSQESQRMLSEQLKVFNGKHDGPENLIIYVYAGHSRGGTLGYPVTL